jgi:hypothetical protein
MEAILATLITGFFSLLGIWYQNYLSKKNAAAAPAIQPQPGQRAPPVAPAENKVVLRILFTVAIVALPWILFQMLLPFATYQRFHDETGRDRAMFYYYGLWMVITILATVSGWRRKTIWEKIILFGSMFFLVVNIYSLFKSNRLSDFM